jgi:hypothetical protein
MTDRSRVVACRQQDRPGPRRSVTWIRRRAAARGRIRANRAGFSARLSRRAGCGWAAAHQPPAPTTPNRPRPRPPEPAGHAASAAWPPPQHPRSWRPRVLPHRRAHAPATRAARRRFRATPTPPPAARPGVARATTRALATAPAPGRSAPHRPHTGWARFPPFHRPPPRRPPACFLPPVCAARGGRPGCRGRSTLVGRGIARAPRQTE